MQPTYLRVYYGPEEDGGAAVLEEPASKRTVTVTLGEVFPILMDALQSQRAWVRDFHQDEITVSEELYEVMQAYRQFRRPSA